MERLAFLVIVRRSQPQSRSILNTQFTSFILKTTDATPDKLFGVNRQVLKEIKTGPECVQGERGEFC